MITPNRIGHAMMTGTNPGFGALTLSLLGLRISGAAEVTKAEAGVPDPAGTVLRYAVLEQRGPLVALSVARQDVRLD